MDYKSAVIQESPDAEGWILGYVQLTLSELMKQFEGMPQSELKKGIEYDFGVKGKMYLFDTLPELLKFVNKNQKFLKLS